MGSAVLEQEVYGEQPDVEGLGPVIDELFARFGGRVERLTARTLDPAERAIVDANLLKLQIRVEALEANHRTAIASYMLGEGAIAANDNMMLTANA